MRILNISANFSLLHLRGALLTALGFEVANALGASTGICALRTGLKCEAVILCHTLSNAEKLRLEGAIQDTPQKPFLIELYLIEMPTTFGIALDAAMDFLPFVNRWAESLAVPLRGLPGAGLDRPWPPLLLSNSLSNAKNENSHRCPVSFLAGPHFRAALRS